jgi:hypothetical protein
MGEQLLNAMGLKNAVQLRQYRSLLSIKNDLWSHADDHDLTEFELRTIEQNNDHTVTGVTVSEKLSRYERLTTRLVPKLFQDAKKLKREEREEFIVELERWLEVLRNARD